MNNNTFTYPYALNEEGKPVCIEEITNENRRDCKYHCYGCGAELIPVLGKIREHHFRHKNNEICDRNKYLHEFAKAAIKKRFDENDSFIVKFHAHMKCRKADTCIFYKQNKWPECEYECKNDMYPVDLKKYYDTCTNEKGFYQNSSDGKTKRYIADLFLSDSKKNEKEQICIEVWVTHECTNEKKQEGGRIIEIKVTKESDAFREIIESDDSNLPIRFFNFKNSPSEKRRYFYHVKLISTFTKKKITIEKLSCELGLQNDPDTVYELIVDPQNKKINNNFLRLFFAAKCYSKGIVVPNCRLCIHNHDDDKNEETINCNLQLTNSFLECMSFECDKKELNCVLKDCNDVKILSDRN